MRKAFEILAFTLLELVIYILLLSGFYYLFCSLIQNSLGTSISFSLPYLWSCIVRFTPSCAIFSLMLLVFSFIRRNCSFKEMILPYAIVSILVWVVLVPFSLRYDNAFNTFTYYGESFEGTSVGFTWWISRLSPGSDAAKLFAFPDWTAYLIARLEKLHYWLLNFFQGSDKGMGLIRYASFVLSLAAIGCFARFSTWRLWNVFFVIFAFGASLVLNSYLFDDNLMKLVLQRLSIPSGWAEMLPVLVNAGIFLLYTLFGVFSLIGEARRERR